ncbi:MAG: UMP kinase [Alphaproteobacteria bacterium]|nr:UMP kinase [Alphaproteobacteria bacterium]
MPKKRILIKISGESLADHGGGNGSVHPSPSSQTHSEILKEKKVFHFPTLSRIAIDMIALKEQGFELCIVVGGGNIVRGSELAQTTYLDRPTADTMGMLATIINAIALQQAIESNGVHCRVMSSFDCQAATEPYVRRRAMRHMEKGKIVIFAAGSGNPYFTTDSAAALRALEMNCDVLLKATTVDGVYSADPKYHKDAIFYETLSYDEVIQKNLKVMDATAFTLLRDHGIPLIIFSIEKTHDIVNFIAGRGRCTRII